MPRKAIAWTFRALFAATMLWPAVAGAAALGLEHVRQLVVEKKLSSIEELLLQLPALYRSRYALMFASRSLQASSYQEPRVILYGLDGKFLLSFNGNARNRGFDALEMIEFDEATKQFLFQEVTFPRKADHSGKVEFSEINPDKCAACHGKPSRPIWDAHPSWPGAYGESYQAHPSKAEEDGFQTFLRVQGSHPRYRHLVGIDGFVYRSTFRPSAKDKYNGVQAESPNAELGTLLARLNGESIVGAVKGHAGFEAHKHALLASLSRRCTDLDEYFPDDVGAAVKKAYERFSQRTDEVNRRQLRLKQARMRANGSRIVAESAVDDSNSLKRFRFIVETGLGTSTKEWTLALEKDTYDFTAAGSVLADLEASILPEVTRTDPGVVKLHFYELRASSDKYCSTLARQSRAALSAMRPVSFESSFHPIESASAAPVPSLVRKCLACHGPPIEPFLLGQTDSPRPLPAEGRYPNGSLLDEILFRLSPQARDKRMPPDAVISDEERAEVEAYLRGLQR